MIVFLKETDVPMVGLPMRVISLVASQTIFLTRAGLLEHGIATGIYMEYQSQTKCLTLQINYESLPSLKKTMEELPTSYLMGLLPRRRSLGLGVNMWGLISTLTICTLALRKRAMQMARSLISQ